MAWFLGTSGYPSETLINYCLHSNMKSTTATQVFSPCSLRRSLSAWLFLPSSCTQPALPGRRSATRWKVTMEKDSIIQPFECGARALRSGLVTTIHASTSTRLLEGHPVRPSPRLPSKLREPLRTPARLSLIKDSSLLLPSLSSSVSRRARRNLKNCAHAARPASEARTKPRQPSLFIRKAPAVTFFSQDSPPFHSWAKASPASALHTMSYAWMHTPSCADTCHVISLIVGWSPSLVNSHDHEQIQQPTYKMTETDWQPLLTQPKTTTNKDTRIR